MCLRSGVAATNGAWSRGVSMAVVCDLALVDLDRFGWTHSSVAGRP